MVQLIDGAHGKLRNGVIVGPFRALDNGGPYAYVSGAIGWTQNGRFLQSGAHDARDVVEVWPGKRDTVTTTESPKALVFDWQDDGLYFNGRKIGNLYSAGNDGRGKKYNAHLLGQTLTQADGFRGLKGDHAEMVAALEEAARQWLAPLNSGAHS
jgi:hypothetical protein